MICNYDARDEHDDNVIINTILTNRGIDDIYHFLLPQKEDLIPFDKLKNIHKAFEIIDEGLIMNYKFEVIFDTDCDGITAGSIMYKWLKNFTNNLTTYIN